MMLSIHTDMDQLGSGYMYDLSQCDDSVRDGDVLISYSDGVFGFLAEAWPVAVSEVRGEFHTMLPVEFAAEYGDRYDESIKLATRAYMAWKSDPSTATPYAVQYHSSMHGDDRGWVTSYTTYDAPLAASAVARHEDTEQEPYYRLVDVKTGEVVMGAKTDPA